ncbi:MAG: hypothetical protein IPK80_32780 [Nannocystis sp.]|nr:hypothetical protein [Nannocystis sp.]
MIRHRASLLALLLALACEEQPRTYSAHAAARPPLFRDDFESPTLGPAWRTTGAGARIEAGALRVEGLQNHPVWLTRELPDDIRVDFDAWTPSDEGDIKVEIAGDGVSAARTASYIASGYVVIFGGWNNSQSAIARRREHGRDRLTAAAPRVEPGRRYHFTLVRQHGALRWELDGREILTYDDDTPLIGAGHRHFAFSGWQSPVYFDNLAIHGL